MKTQEEVIKEWIENLMEDVEYFQQKYTHIHPTHILQMCLLFIDMKSAGHPIPKDFHTFITDENGKMLLKSFQIANPYQ